MEEVKLQEPMAPPMGEWHRTPENEKIIRRIIHKAYGPEYLVGIAHHICIYCPDGSLREEISSAEALIFSHRVAQRIFPDLRRRLGILYDLAGAAEETRLTFYGYAMDVQAELEAKSEKDGQAHS